MERSRGTCLYREARLNIEPAFPGSTISITLPAQDISTFGARTVPRRSVATEQYIHRDEDAFAMRHLASDGSMFFRRHHEYPRSFLWRTLDNRKTLEIQSVDLDHDVSHNLEANITLLLHFASPIRPFCVAFAEPEDRDALTVFTITSANELYTITLHRDFFMRPAASEQEISDWCKRSSLSQLMLRNPFRMAAPSNNELLVSLDNGAILYLTRNSKDDVVWNESVYLQTNWSVRGWLSWKSDQKVRFDNGDLDVSAAAAVALSPDEKHIFSVCLNHRLRAWNVASGKPGIQTDLLGEPEHPNEKTAPYLIGPTQPHLMAIVPIPGGVDGANYYVATYSPKQHQFKFWGIRDADDAEHGLYDFRSEFDFIPPVDELMDTTAWTLAEFFINPGPAGWRGVELWIRARSGPSSRVYTLKFDLNGDLGKLANTWKDGWVSIDSGPLSVEQLKQYPANLSELELEVFDPFEEDLIDQWLEFLFYPSRFTTTTLEAALIVFQRGIPRENAAEYTSRGSLKERICTSIMVSSTSEPAGHVSQEGHRHRVAAQFQAFYSLVKDLHKRRGEHLSLVFDYEQEMPWVVLSDYLSAIRQCSNAETIALNSAVLTSSERLVGPLRRVVGNPGARDVSRLLNAAASFRRNLPRSFHPGLQREVERELFQNRSVSVIDRMELMEDDCNLSQQVSDDDLSALIEDLGMDVKDLTMETFFLAMQTLEQEEQGRTREKRQAARFGLNALVRVSQESLDTRTNFLLDLLVLVLFMQYDEDLSEDFDASEIFVEIFKHLKDCAVQTWLASTVWSHQASTGPSSEKLMKSLSENLKNSKQLSFTQTVLEGFLGHRSFDVAMPKGLKCELLTYWSQVWLAQLFRDWTFDAAVDAIMGVLLLQSEFALASKFSKFMQDGEWATYLKARMLMANGENTSASISFQKAANNLALGSFNLDAADTINFTPAEQRDSFSNGLPRYYHHVLSLFEKCKAYPYVADFARLGLRSLRGREDEELKTELLSRLFNASIQTSRFDDAYSAMTRHTNVALRSAALQTLITTMITQSQAATLLAYPFVGLQNEVDSILASLAHKTLNLSSGPQYHNILYSHRIARNNFRGAASILHERLQRLKSTSSQVHNPGDESLTQCYLLIINALESVGKDEAYILAEKRVDELAGGKLNWGIGKAKTVLKRQIVTLESLRREYAEELDRVEMVEKGEYPFVEPERGDEMEFL